MEAHCDGRGQRPRSGALSDGGEVVALGNGLSSEMRNEPEGNAPAENEKA